MSSKNTFFRQKLTLNIGGNLVDLSTPKVMGIVNLTPDSYYDGGEYNTISQTLKRCASILEEGGTIIDLGACSTHPGAEHVSHAEEMRRLLPILKAIVKEFPKALISIDTFRAAIAEAAVQEGALIINDISAGELDSAMFATLAKLKVPYILMHMRGTPQTMSSLTDYDDLIGEINSYFIRKIKQLQSLGVVDLIIDPGFGFAKTIDQNYDILNKLDSLKMLGLPVLVGISRKIMIYKFLEIDPAEALNGTIVANTIALLKGANILRVHDVKPAVEAIKIFNKLENKENSCYM